MQPMIKESAAIPGRKKPAVLSKMPKKRAINHLIVREENG